MAVIIGTVIYKITTLLIGFGITYLGYRLLLSGVFEGGGDLNVAFSDNKLILKKASPGTFFVLFGTAIIIFSLWKGQELGSLESSSTRSEAPIESAESKKAVDTIKRIVSGNQEVDSLSEVEYKMIGDLISEIEDQSTNTVTSKIQRSRGIASEE